LQDSLDDVLKKIGLPKKNDKAGFSRGTACPCWVVIPAPAVAEKMEAGLQKKLDEIRGVVAERRVRRVKDDPLVFLMGRILYPPITEIFFRMRFPETVKSFYADPKCTGCGLCEKVCLSGRIRMRNGRPEWIDGVDCVY
jgi:ferredoxin